MAVCLCRGAEGAAPGQGGEPPTRGRASPCHPAARAFCGAEKAGDGKGDERKEIYRELW